MKYKIDEEVLFKHHYGNDWFVSKGIIISYSESMTYYDNNLPIGSIQHTTQSVAAPYGVVQNHNPKNQKRGPGYLIKTIHSGIYNVQESDITDVIKKKLLKKN